MPAEPSDRTHQDLIGRLELECRDAEARLRKASDDHSLARVDKRNAEARLLRAQSPPDGGNFCIMCWVNYQRLSYLRPVPSAGPRLTDRWACEAADCDYAEDRRAAVR
jgi:hypothetical protein